MRQRYKLQGLQLCRRILSPLAKSFRRRHKASACSGTNQPYLKTLAYRKIRQSFSLAQFRHPLHLKSSVASSIDRAETSWLYLQSKKFFKMVYNWEGKEEICYQMYIEQKKSLEEIMEYLKTAHNFSPRYVVHLPLSCKSQSLVVGHRNYLR